MYVNVSYMCVCVCIAGVGQVLIWGYGFNGQLDNKLKERHVVYMHECEYVCA